MKNDQANSFKSESKWIKANSRKHRKLVSLVETWFIIFFVAWKLFSPAFIPNGMIRRKKKMKNSENTHSEWHALCSFYINLRQRLLALFRMKVLFAFLMCFSVGMLKFNVKGVYSGENSVFFLINNIGQRFTCTRLWRPYSKILNNIFPVCLAISPWELDNSGIEIVFWIKIKIIIIVFIAKR